MTEDSTAATFVVSVNGADCEVRAGSTARDLLVTLGFSGRPVAVELNEQVVPRADLGDRLLTPGDRLEIVTLVGGG